MKTNHTRQKHHHRGTARARAVASLVIGLAIASTLASAAQAERRSINTPGYEGTRKAPRTEPAVPAPKPVVLSHRSEVRAAQHVIVDAAGTGHLAWNDDAAAGEPLRYCRLKRGASACDAGATLPDAPAVSGPFVVAYGDQLVLLTQREGGVVYAHVSSDGGDTFQERVRVGGTTTEQRASESAVLQGAVTFGAPGSEQIALIYSGGWFQTVRPGVPPALLTKLVPDEPSGSGRRPSAIAAGPGTLTAAVEASNKTLVRTWRGSGDPADAANWTEPAVVLGMRPQLGGGAGGVALKTHDLGKPALLVRRLDAAGTPGRAVGPAGPDDNANVVATPVVEPNGDVRLAWPRSLRDRRGVKRGEALVTATLSGSRLGAFKRLYVTKAPTFILGPSLAGLPDGGGFALFERASGGKGATAIVAAAFGSQQPTGRLGLGNEPGGKPNTDPGVLETCSRIEFGAIDVVGAGGCLLGAVGRPGTKVSEGTIKLNGLEIVPGPGVKILLNSRQRTVDTTGSVTLQMRAGDVVLPLYRGELHLKLPSDPDRTQAAPGCTGVKLLGFDADISKPFVKGFPIQGQVAVFLGEDSACIPVALGLPKAFGGIRGNAVLRANNAKGLILESLRISAQTVPLGPLLVEDLDIAYASFGNEWRGAAQLGLPPQPGGAKIAASVRFVDGAFKGGTFTLTFPFPGITLDPFAATYLRGIGGGFGLDPTSVTGNVTIGVLLSPRPPTRSSSPASS